MSEQRWDPETGARVGQTPEVAGSGTFSVSSVISESVEVFRRQFKTILALTSVFVSLLFLAMGVMLITVFSAIPQAGNVLARGGRYSLSPEQAGRILPFIYIGVPVLIVVLLFAYAIWQIALIVTTGADYKGQSVSMAYGCRQAIGRLLPIIGTSLLIGICLFPVLLVAGLLVAASQCLIIPAFLLFIVGAIYLNIRLMFLTQEITLNEKAGLGAITEAFDASSGNFWNILLLGFIYWLAPSVVNTVLSPMTSLMMMIPSPAGIVLAVVVSILGAFATSLLMAWGTVGITLAYLRLTTPAHQPGQSPV